MKKFCFLFILPLLVMNNIYPFFKHEISKQERIVNKLLCKISKELERKYKIKTIGTCVGMPSGVVGKLGLDFQVRGAISKDEARKILIESTEYFLEIINSHEELQPYLKNYPFTAGNIGIILFIVDHSGNHVFHPNIDTAQVFCGELEYTTTKEETPLKYFTEVRESYEVAFKKVQTQLAP